MTHLEACANDKQEKTKDKKVGAKDFSISGDPLLVETTIDFSITRLKACENNQEEKTTREKVEWRDLSLGGDPGALDEGVVGHALECHLLHLFLFITLEPKVE